MDPPADGAARVVASTSTTAPDGAVTVTRVATATRPPAPPAQVIGIVGFGNFGQFLAGTFVKQGHQYVSGGGGRRVVLVAGHTCARARP